MTKPRAPTVVDSYYLRLKFYLFRETTNTAGSVSVGVFFAGGAQNNLITLDVTQYATGRWHYCEFTVNPSAYTPAPLVPYIVNNYMSGGEVWICNLDIAIDQLQQSYPISTSTGAVRLGPKDNGTVLMTPTSVLIEAESKTPVQAGYNVKIVNYSGAALTITPDTGVTLRTSPGGALGAVNLDAYGQADLLRVSADTWLVTFYGRPTANIYTNVLSDSLRLTDVTTKAGQRTLVLSEALVLSDAGVDTVRFFRLGTDNLGGTTLGVTDNARQFRLRTRRLDDETLLKVYDALGFAGGDTVALNVGTYITDTEFLFGGVDAKAGYRMYTTGTNKGWERSTTDGSTETNIKQWCSPAANASNYEVRVINFSGDTPDEGVPGTSYGASVSLTLTQSNSSTGVKTCTFDVQVRRISDTTVMDTQTVNLYAEVTP